MNQNQINEVKKQLWDYLMFLNEKQRQHFEKLGYNSWGVISEINFCRNEIEYWKEMKIDV